MRSRAAAVNSYVPKDAGITGFQLLLRAIPYNFYAILTIAMAFALALCLSIQVTAFATGGGGGDVAGTVQSTWRAASGQIKAVVNTVVFPAVDMILAVFFFIKLGMSHFEYQRSGHFEWTGPAILFVCLVLTLTAPTYI